MKKKNISEKYGVPQNMLTYWIKDGIMKNITRSLNSASDKNKMGLFCQTINSTLLAKRRCQSKQI